jgi:bacteriorhodopsin
MTQISMSKDSTFGYVVDSLIKEPVTYLNTAVGVASFMSIEEKVKIVFYIISIIATVIVSYKYILEIKQIKKQDKEIDGKSNRQEDISDLLEFQELRNH